MHMPSYRYRDIRETLEATGMRGQNITFLDDYSPAQIESLFDAAEMIEPFMRTGLHLLDGKVLYSLFFQPSTRTRASHEAAMLRMGGGVITESDPLHQSSAAKNESLSDTLEVISQYADAIVMRHPDAKVALGALEHVAGHTCPVISGGYGNITHPTQGLLDAYTCRRVFGQLSEITVAIASPDLSRARSGHSFALALALMGAKIIYTGRRQFKTPDLILEKLKALHADVEEYFDLTDQENETLYMDKGVDVIYLPGCSVTLNDPHRADFEEAMQNYYVSLDMLTRIKERTGKTVGVHHSLPRNPGEFDFRIDRTDHQLYFRAIGYSVAVRMALLAAVIGID